MKGRNPSKKNPVTVRGPWFAMPIDFLRSRACAELSPHALKMLIDVSSQLGPNARGNGDLSAAAPLLSARGWTSKASCQAALAELVRADLLVVTRTGNRRRCALYAVTLWPMQCDMSKLEIRGAAYSTSEWEKGGALPTEANPARWKSLRKNAISTPATGAMNQVMPPLRGKGPVPDATYAPSVGAKLPVLAISVPPLRGTYLDMPSVGAASRTNEAALRRPAADLQVDDNAVPWSNLMEQGNCI